MKNSKEDSVIDGGFINDRAFVHMGDNKIRTFNINQLKVKEGIE